MGADTFFTVAEGRTADHAFRAAQEEARDERGRRGYTGTIAEKPGFVLLDFDREAPAALRRLRAGDVGAADRLAKALVGPHKAEALAEALIDSGDPRVDDKWGPAAALKLAEGRWLFFGWASS